MCSHVRTLQFHHFISLHSGLYRQNEADNTGGLKEIKGQKGETQTMVVTDDSGKKKEITLFTLTL